MRKVQSLDWEKLAYWYFRLNGCLTIQNFVLHPDWGREQRTDIDLMAVRFPHRAELFTQPMQDDEILLDNQVIRIFFVEAKSRTCNLNGPWTDPQRKNMQRALRAIGVLPLGEVEVAAQALYKRGHYRDLQFDISLFCVGSATNRELQRRYPDVPQITWENVSHFIYRRFIGYKDQKSAHPQWDRTGKRLWRIALKCSTQDEFWKSVGSMLENNEERNRA